MVPCIINISGSACLILEFLNYNLIQRVKKISAALSLIIAFVSISTISQALQSNCFSLQLCEKFYIHCFFSLLQIATRYQKATRAKDMNCPIYLSFMNWFKSAAIKGAFTSANLKLTSSSPWMVTNCVKAAITVCTLAGNYFNSTPPGAVFLTTFSAIKDGALRVLGTQQVLQLFWLASEPHFLEELNGPIIHFLTHTFLKGKCFSFPVSMLVRTINKRDARLWCRRMIKTNTKWSSNSVLEKRT